MNKDIKDTEKETERLEKELIEKETENDTHRSQLEKEKSQDIADLTETHESDM